MTNASAGWPCAIYVDADACPVKEQIYRVAARYDIDVTVVSNTYMRVPEGIRFVQVAGGLDVADDWIADAAGPGDIVTTADIPLAHRSIEAGATVIDFRGREFTSDAIGGLMASRELGQLIRASGGNTGGPKPLSQRDRGLFAGKLDEVVNRLRRASADAAIRLGGQSPLPS